jgi:hypothetical protein
MTMGWSKEKASARRSRGLAFDAQQEAAAHLRRQND